MAKFRAGLKRSVFFQRYSIKFHRFPKADPGIADRRGSGVSRSRPRRK
jgi:hypothetical protein